MEKIWFNAFGQQPVVLQRKIPASMQQLVIPGSIGFAAEEWFADMLYQVVRFPECNFGSWILDCKKDVNLTIRSERPATLLLIALEQQANSFLYGLGNVSLPTKSSLLVYLPSLESVLHCKKGNRYSYIGLEFDPEVYAHYAGEFPLLDSFLRETIVQPETSSCYLDIPGKLPESALQLITNLLATDCSSRSNIQYGNIQLKAFLQLLFGENNSVLHSSITPAALLHRLRKEIQADMLHAPDFSRAALKHNISKAKLLKDFKALYRLPPYQYWQYYRMTFHAARQIIETDKKIKNIVAAMGFGKETGNFTRKFKDYCRFAPLAYKRVYTGRASSNPG